MCRVGRRPVLLAPLNLAKVMKSNLKVTWNCEARYKCTVLNWPKAVKRERRERFLNSICVKNRCKLCPPIPHPPPLHTVLYWQKKWQRRRSRKGRIAKGSRGGEKILFSGVFLPQSHYRNKTTKTSSSSNNNTNNNSNSNSNSNSNKRGGSCFVDWFSQHTVEGAFITQNFFLSTVFFHIFSKQKTKKIRSRNYIFEKLYFSTFFCQTLCVGEN